MKIELIIGIILFFSFGLNILMYSILVISRNIVHKKLDGEIELLEELSESIEDNIKNLEKIDQLNEELKLSHIAHMKSIEKFAETL